MHLLVKVPLSTPLEDDMARCFQKVRNDRILEIRCVFNILGATPHSGHLGLKKMMGPIRIGTHTLSNDIPSMKENLKSICQRGHPDSARHGKGRFCLVLSTSHELQTERLRTLSLISTIVRFLLMPLELSDVGPDSVVPKGCDEDNKREQHTPAPSKEVVSMNVIEVSMNVIETLGSTVW